MKKPIVFLLLILVNACTNIPSQIERDELAWHIAKQHGWEKLPIITDQFILQSFLPPQPNKADTLTIYLEGDGFAWIKPSLPSTNPTPNNPLALKLAVLDTRPAAYLARPCQYIAEGQSKNCTQQYWTSHRFSTEVIDSTNQAVDQLKQKFSAQKLILVGYSGGGAVAALVAAKRDDVVKLVTVAGNLDHQSWTNQHHYSPLLGSLNPTDAWVKLQSIPQQHYVGGKDTTIDESIVRSYASRFKLSDNLSISILPGFDHHCCWESIWSDLVAINFSKPNHN